MRVAFMGVCEPRLPLPASGHARHLALWSGHLLPQLVAEGAPWAVHPFCLPCKFTGGLLYHALAASPQAAAKLSSPMLVVPVQGGQATGSEIQSRFL